MTQETFIQVLLAALEGELRSLVARVEGDEWGDMFAMISYHMGWEGRDTVPGASGKRLRPLLVLLTAASAGGEWCLALPAAAAVELLHNFSLIHDDIEDHSPLRRGRATVWSRWGVAQAINTGDALFTLAQLAILDLEKTVSPQMVLQAMRIFQTACLELTRGQHLDIAYGEARPEQPFLVLSPDDYWPMARGKTAALLAASAELGALIGGAEDEIRLAYRCFGEYLGLAFQVLDDMLGIWGEQALLGKSTASDLLEGKKSLPVLYGLSRGGRFAERWLRGNIQPDEVAGLARQLEIEGGREYTQRMAQTLTSQALKALEEAYPQGEGGEALRFLSEQMLNRER